jgi:hypothetical protein
MNILYRGKTRSWVACDKIKDEKTVFSLVNKTFDSTEIN